MVIPQLKVSQDRQASFRKWSNYDYLVIAKIYFSSIANMVYNIALAKRAF